MGRPKNLIPRADVVERHGQGKNNRQIGRELGICHRTVAAHLVLAGLTTNGPIRQHIELVGKDSARCSKCKKISKLSEWPILRAGDKYPYRLSYCVSCRKKQVYASTSKTPATFIKDRFHRTKLMAKKTGTKFKITADYLIAQYERQKGKCFYTDAPLVLQLGQGVSPHSLSIDKVDPKLGYVPGNVVMCGYRVNKIKNDVTPEEMKAWLPNWHKRTLKLKADA